VEACGRNLQDGLIENYLATEEVQKVTTTTQVKVMEIRDGVTAMDQAVRGLDNRFQEIDSNIVELKDFISEQINDALASKNRMFQMLKDVVSGKVFSSFYRKWRSFQTVFLCDEPDPGLILNPRRTATLSSPDELLILLRVPLEQAIFDLDFVLRQSKEFDSTSKSYGALVMASPRFQQWVDASETDLIYVEGRVGNSPTLVQSDRGLTTLVQSQRRVVQSSLLDLDHGAEPRIAV
jgi:hypothetical protein